MSTKPAPVLNQINLVVADMAASVAFYRRLGLTIDDTHPFSAHHINIHMPGGLKLELDSIAFAKHWDAGWRSAPGTARNVIGFNLPSRRAVDDLFAKLTAAGHPGQQAPYDAFWGAGYAVVEDPDGNPVGLMSPIEANRKSTPPTM